MGVKLEHGKQYKTRNGHVFTVFRTVGDDEFFETHDGSKSWMDNGNYWSDGTTSGFDLIEEVAEEEGNEPAKFDDALARSNDAINALLHPAPEGIKSDGSTASYYELPAGATQLQDLISDRDMNAQIGEIFRAAYRYGQASHSDKLRDAKKMKFYIDAEIERLMRLP